MGIDILTLAAARAGKGGGSASKYKQPDWGAEGEKIVLPEATYEVDPDTGMVAIMQEFTLVEGAEYIVNYNGVEYKCICSALNAGDEEKPRINYLIGNIGAVTGGNPTTDPFAIMRASDEEVAELGFYGALLPFDGSASVTVSVRSDIVHKIPKEYIENPNAPLLVTLNDRDVSSSTSFDVDFDTIWEAFKAGRNIILRTDDGDNASYYRAIEGSHTSISFAGIFLVPDYETILDIIVLEHTGSVHVHRHNLKVEAN